MAQRDPVERVGGERELLRSTLPDVEPRPAQPLQLGAGAVHADGGEVAVAGRVQQPPCPAADVEQVARRLGAEEVDEAREEPEVSLGRVDGHGRAA